MERIDNPVSPDVNITLRVNPFEVVENMARVPRRKLTLHQLAELAINEPLSPDELQAVQRVVEAVNRHTQWRFTTYNSGLPEPTAKLIGLKP